MGFHDIKQLTIFTDYIWSMKARNPPFRMISVKRGIFSRCKLFPMRKPRVIYLAYPRRPQHIGRKVWNLFRFSIGHQKVQYSSSHPIVKCVRKCKSHHLNAQAMLSSVVYLSASSSVQLYIQLLLYIYIDKIKGTSQMVVCGCTVTNQSLTRRHLSWLKENWNIKQSRKCIGSKLRNWDEIFLSFIEYNKRKLQCNAIYIYIYILYSVTKENWSKVNDYNIKSN